ncbi:MAG TPA: L,D-transpeptidase family protein [Actinomycetes bacterium]
MHTDHDRAPGHALAVVRRWVTALVTAILASAGMLIAVPHSAEAASTAYRVEYRLMRLGYNPGAVDGVITSRTRQALCAWRETHGLRIGRYTLTSRDTASVLSATSRPTTSRSNGLYVNKTCQILYQVVDHKYRRIVWVSTGKPGYDTPNGTGYVWKKWAGWHTSSIYSGAQMYDSIYFRRDRPGIALHGSISNDLVKPYPASHGCVRVLRPKIHYIFQETPIGRKVVVYGSYS